MNTRKTKKKKKIQKSNLAEPEITGSEPEEIGYSDIAEIVEYLVKTKCNNYTFDCWTREDIGQEIRIICFKALAHFDVSRVGKDKWKNFFGRCVDNGLKNLKRDNYLRAAPPCGGDCGFLHGAEAEENLELGMACKRWLKFKANLKRKIKILHPIPIEVIGDSVRDFSADNDLETRDLEQHIISRMPEKLREPLSKMLTGKDKEVSRKDKQKVREYVGRILE